MKQIKINDVVYDIKFNLSAAIAFERETNLNALTITDGKIEHLIQMGYAMIVGNNKDKEIPSFEDFFDILNNDVFLATEFMNVIASELNEVAKLKPGDKKDSGKKGNDSKN